MQLRPLPEILVLPYFGAKLVKLIEAANKRIRTMAANRKSFEEQHRRAQESNVRDVDLLQQIGGASVQNKLLILQDELTFREAELADLLVAMHQATCQEVDRRYVDLDKARSETRERLLTAGYMPEAPSGESQKGCIVPLMIETHPLVSAAREAAESLRATAAERPGPAENEAEIEKLTTAIERIRQRALAIT
jgi:hypothetical protein